MNILERTFIDHIHQCHWAADAHLLHTTPPAVLQCPVGAQSRHTEATACYCRSSQGFFTPCCVSVRRDNDADEGTPCSDPRLQCFKAEMLDVPGASAIAFASNQQDHRYQRVLNISPEAEEALLQQGRLQCGCQAPTPYTVPRTELSCLMIIGSVVISE